MKINSVKSVYFAGAGGIGMSALVRYFLSKGKIVAGYDRTPTDLTKKLIKEGAEIHYEDDETLIPDYCRDKENTLVIFTPAIPSSHRELTYFRDNGFDVFKRSQVLGLITNAARGLCVAGTHGKTTVSSMAAHILKQSGVGCNAFLGGILNNYDNNHIFSEHSSLNVIEADEYDRSFHNLEPYMAVITSVDPDHLDIYKTPRAYHESFEKFTSLIRPEGALIMKKGLPVSPDLKPEVKFYTYSGTDNTSDFYAENISIVNESVFFDFVSPFFRVDKVELGVPVMINIENAVAAMAMASLNGVTGEEMRVAMGSFAGVKRRFDFHLRTKQIVYIDDYAHHPSELQSCISSLKELYKGRKITGIFQPHLYSRTRDFVAGFASVLSLLDKLILLDIYPAREEPIEGITSEIIFDQVTIDDKILCSKEELLGVLEKQELDVLATLGAGDIDQMVLPIRKMLEKKYV